MIGITTLASQPHLKSVSVPTNWMIISTMPSGSCGDFTSACTVGMPEAVSAPKRSMPIFSRMLPADRLAMEMANTTTARNKGLIQLILFEWFLSGNVRRQNGLQSLGLRGSFKRKGNPAGMFSRNSDGLGFSLRAGAAQDDGNGEDYNLQIEPDGPAVNVFEIQPNPVPEIGDLVPPADLPEASETGFHAQAATVRQVVETPDLVHGQGAWPDEAHLAAQDVKKLRQFVETVFAEEFPDGRDAGIVGDLEHGA